MAMKTARSSLYFIDPDADSSGDAVIEVGCVIDLNGIEASREQLEKTCMRDSARQYEAGVATPGAATMTVNFDTADPSHLRMYELWREGVNLNWALGLSDGPPFPAELIPPEVDSTGLEFDLPDTRSWVLFNGFIQNIPLNLALNAYMTGQISVQVSDFPTIVPKAA